jgi:hypothetical protein
MDYMPTRLQVAGYYAVAVLVLVMLWATTTYAQGVSCITTYVGSSAITTCR